MNPKPTGLQQDAKGRFMPGTSGNMAGRPLGSRNKLGDMFLKALLADFTVHGAEAICAVRAEDPSTYLRVVAGTLPKEITGEDGIPLLSGIVVTFVRADEHG